MLLSCLTLLGEIKASNILGRIRDPSHAAITNARVWIINQDTGHFDCVVSTDDTGVFVCVDLPPGRYKIKAEAPGFNTDEAEVDLQLNKDARVDFNLTTGPSSESFEARGLIKPTSDIENVDDSFRALKDASARAINTAGRDSHKTLVADANTGMAIGFLESADQDDRLLYVSSGTKVIIKRAFKKAADVSLPDKEAVYVLNLLMHPDKLERATIENKQAALPVVESGRLLNQDFYWEIVPAAGFTAADIYLSGEINYYPSESAKKSNNPSRTDTLDVPGSHLKLVAPPTPWANGLSQLLDVLQKLFGVIGGIPTLVLGYWGLRVIRKSRAETKA